MVWDRCNYSDNIKGRALPAVLSPQAGECEAWVQECSFLVLYSLHFPFSLLREHMFMYSPLFGVVCKAGFVPVGWKANEGKSCCYCAAVDCAPTTPSSLLTVSPKQDRCSVCMLPAFPPSIFLPGMPDYCSICLILLSECLLFVQCSVLEVRVPI